MSKTFKDTPSSKDDRTNFHDMGFYDALSMTYEVQNA